MSHIFHRHPAIATLPSCPRPSNISLPAISANGSLSPNPPASPGSSSPFGYTTTILGGTLAELIAPLACFSYFFVKRETTGAAFCAFWFFENFLYIGTYMADARTLALPLVGSGDHDWEILFTQWNVLIHDVQIGHATRSLGWLGMLTVVAWLAHRILESSPESAS